MINKALDKLEMTAKWADEKPSHMVVWWGVILGIVGGTMYFFSQVLI
jgi:hypothetical protein